MSYITDGEVWVDSEFAKDTSGAIGSNGGRTYSKSNAGLALVCFYRASDSNYTDPMIISNTAEKAAYTPYGGVNTVVVDGVTWYYYTGGGMGSLTPSTDFPFFNFKDGVLPTVNYADVAAWIISQGYIMNHSPAPSFFVEYMPNGGTGAMSAQSIEIDVPTKLKPCEFERTDYDFVGWATEPNGSTVYSDEEEVLNLAGEDETITLYAVWSPKPPHFILQYNESDSDHLDKDITDIHDLVGVFRDDCTIEDPVILLEGNPDLLTGVNYFTIPKFNRSYFLTGQRIVRTNLIEISGHVDVLSSFKTYIRQQTAIVKRQETNKAYNLYIDDSSLRSYQNPIVLTQNFPQGFNGHSFILVTAGIEGTSPVNPPGDFTLNAFLDETTNNISLVWTPSSDVEYYMVTRREATAPPPFNFFYNIVNKTTNTSYEDRPLFLREFEYQIVAVNKYGNTFSNIATPSPSEFMIIQQPVDYTGAIGDTATFTIQTNRAGVTYQWQVKVSSGSEWRNVASGGTSPIYQNEITSARLVYLFRCLATYEGVTLTSNECRMIEG